MLDHEQALISPKKFSSLVAWYDAAQITGLSNGVALTSWSDLSGNGFDLTGGPPYSPVYYTNVKNGLPALAFDGLNDSLSLASFGQTFSNLTIFCVVRPGSSSGSMCLIDGYVPGTYRAPIYKYSSCLALGTSYGTIALAPNDVTDFMIVCARFNSSSSYLMINGYSTYLAPSQTVNGSGSLAGLTIGKQWNGVSYFGGNLGELIIYTGNPSYFMIYQIMKYLSKKWGIKTGSPVVLDTMTRANAETIGACDSNQVWNLGSYDSTTLPTAGIYSNYGYFGTTSGTDSHAWIETGVSDCTITCNIRYDADADKGILFRRVDANNYFYAHIDSTNDNLVISRCLDGVRSDIASTSTATTGVGDQRTWRVFLSGSSITVWTGQNNKIATVTDSNLVTATKHGIYCQSGNTTSFRYFSVEV